MWDDAHGDANWVDEPKTLHPSRVTTVGYLADDRDNEIVIADSYYSEKGKRHFGGVLVIPRGCILKMWWIEFD